jgi:hypothetical protein
MIRRASTSLEPSIERDAWRAINISLTHDLKCSKGESVRIRGTQIRDWITTIDQGEIWTVNFLGGIVSFCG